MAAYPERDAGNNPKPLGVAFHHLSPTFINAYSINPCNAQEAKSTSKSKK